MKLDGVTAIALILIVSFAIDRLVTGILFVLTFSGVVRDPAADDASRPASERRYKVWYYTLAGLFAIVAMAYMGRIQLLKALLPGVEDTSNAFFSVLDVVVTGLVLMGGAERLSAFLKTSPTQTTHSPASPIEVRGKLILEEGGPSKTATIRQ